MAILREKLSGKKSGESGAHNLPLGREPLLVWVGVVTVLCLNVLV